MENSTPDELSSVTLFFNQELPPPGIMALEALARYAYGYHDLETQNHGILMVPKDVLNEAISCITPDGQEFDAVTASQIVRDKAIIPFLN